MKKKNLCRREQGRLQLKGERHVLERRNHGRGTRRKQKGRAGRGWKKRTFEFSKTLKQGESKSYFDQDAGKKKRRISEALKVQKESTGRK